MAIHQRRWALLLLALATLLVSLVACQAPGGSSTPPGNTGAIIISTPVGDSASATPVFPPFTIGAWPSDTTPNVSDTITIYVICQMQDPSMNTPSKPAIGLKVRVSILDPINQSFTKTTGADGIAAVKLSFKDSRPGTPVTVNVSTNWKGVNYTRQIYFTPAPQAKPSPSPGGGGTPGPGGTPPATPIPPPTEPPKP
ncbi:MAG TPA: hypothetical protein VGP82_22720 [Ktedonobacterales bacterium]|nr:hypothetical protein [Ktedonobacterales bacterium]